MDKIISIKAIKKRQYWVEEIRKLTLWGPHLDDMCFMIDGISAQKKASRGQARGLVVSFKLAQMMAINSLKDCSPIIILDDIVSELDEERKNNPRRHQSQAAALDSLFAQIEGARMGGTRRQGAFCLRVLYCRCCR